MAACPLPSTARPPWGLRSVIKAPLSSARRRRSPNASLLKKAGLKPAQRRKDVKSCVFIKRHAQTQQSSCGRRNGVLHHLSQNILLGPRWKQRRTQINHYHQFVNSKVLHCLETNLTSIEGNLLWRIRRDLCELWRRCSAFCEKRLKACLMFARHCLNDVCRKQPTHLCALY